MTTRPPAEIGMTLDEVDTPALIVDLDAFERNLRRLPERIAGTGVRARRRQNPQMSRHRIAAGRARRGRRVRAEGRRGRGDGPRRGPGRARYERDRRAAKIAAAGCARAYRPHRRVRRRSEPDPRARRRGGGGRGHLAGLCRGQHGRQPLRRRAGRAGARPCAADHASAGPRLWRLTGLSRVGEHLRGWEERRQAIAQAADKAGRTRDLLAHHGIDAGHHRRRHRHLRVRIFERRLHRTAMRLLHLHGRRLRPQSRPRRRPDQGLRAEPFRAGNGDGRPTDDRAIVDAGLKALAFDSGPPLVCDEPAATYERASDEHGRLGISGATNRLRIGDKIRLVPGIVTPPSTSTTGTSASAATASNSSGRSPQGALFTDQSAAIPLKIRHTSGTIAMITRANRAPGSRHPGWHAGLPRHTSAGSDAIRLPGRRDTLDEFLRQFPSVRREQAIALLDLARETLAAMRLLLDEHLPIGLFAELSGM